MSLFQIVKRHHRQRTWRRDSPLFTSHEAALQWHRRTHQERQTVYAVEQLDPLASARGNLSTIRPINPATSKELEL